MKTLIIGPSWVGDMMMSQSLYRTLKQQNSNINIDVMAPSWSGGLLTKMPEVDAVIDMPIGHGKLALAERYRIGKSLAIKGYDSAFILPNSFKSALIPFFAHIPKRTGWLGELRYGLLNDYRRLNKAAFPLMVERYIALAFNAHSVSCADEIPKPLLWPRLTVNPSEVSNTITEFGLKAALPLIGFCPGAEFGPAKRWPSYHYAELADMLIRQGSRVLILGSNNDQLIGQDIKNRVQYGEYCTNLAGKTSLEQAISLLAACNGIVTNDSGLMHIAAALNKPLVALYGPSSPDFTPPLSKCAEIIRLVTGYKKIRKGKIDLGYHQGLIDIHPDVVFETLMNLLDRCQRHGNTGMAYG